ncbi:MAG: FeoA domain-containing protein [Gammaproteobacteria bacterium]|nr:FeoA domain-containing protein [Gammaproteobacteria bacterium]
MSQADDWVPGDQMRLLDYGTIDTAFRRQLLAMGMTVGVVIQIVRIAPLGSPIQIDLRGVMTALRREDLLALHWKKLS